MTNLNIAFHDGFEADTVVVFIDGREVRRQGEVKTRRQIGLAFSFEVEVGPGRHRLDVEVLNRGLAARANVEASATPFVGVSIDEGRLAIQFSESDFFYA